MKRDIPSIDYLKDIASQAGEKILYHFRHPVSDTIKANQTPVTLADTEINSDVINKISKDFPHIDIIGEEESHRIGNAQYTILCDPVDGTIPFIAKVPVSTFCITLLEDKIPIKAIIYDPYLKRMWFSEKGKGSFENSKKMQVSPHTTVKDSYASLCWWNSAFHIDKTISVFNKKNCFWVNINSIAYGAGLIANGSMHFSVFPAKHLWETTAMSLIVTEAGGRATDLFGNLLDFSSGSVDGHIISNGFVHDEVVEIVHSAQLQ